MLLEKEESVLHFETEIVTTGRLKEFIRQMNELFDGGSWQGESLIEKLGKLDEMTIFKQPVKGVHCIGEVVWHCIYWRLTFIKTAEGDFVYRDSTVEKYNFLPLQELEKRGWEDLKAQLYSTQHQIIQILSERKEIFLDEEYKPGKTFNHLIEGIIQHDIYHLGQIGLIQKMLQML